jgi:glycerophosphoryl diester phosphodiesterase
MSHPLVIAHRGASHHAPENTLAAFRLAWKQGADAIETDLRLTADGAAVAFHDEDGSRMLGDPRRIHEITLSELSTRGVPSLAEVLATVPDGKHVVLELKEDVVEPLARELATTPHERITLIAFDAEILVRAKQALPRCRALWLFGSYAPTLMRGRALGEWLARKVLQLGLDGVDLRLSSRLNRHVAAPLLEQGLSIFVYTVNGAAACRRCARLGLHGITTDMPAETRQWLGIST